MSAPQAHHAAIQALLALERRHALFDERHDGWSAWRAMRNPVFLAVERLPLASPPTSNLRRAMRAVAQTAALLRILVLPGRRDLLVKTARSGLRWQVGTKFRDVYFDGLLSRGWSYAKLEETNSHDFDAQAAHALHPGTLDPVVFTFWGRILGKFFPVPVVPFCERVAQLVQQETGVRLDPAMLRMRVSTVHWQARLYGALLRRLRPRAVLVCDTGEYALRIAAGRRRIPFIELQHGVFDRSHRDAVPVWVEGDGLALMLPDRLACRGAFWVERLADTRQGRDAAIAVGSEAIDDARCARAAWRRDGLRRIVLTTQGLASAALADWTARLLEAAPPGLEWQLTIKLHPVYDAGTRAYDTLATHARVRIVDGAAQPNVFALLAEADLHLSINSACHYDAAALGVPSGVVPLAGHEDMLDAADGTIIFIASDAAQVWQRIVRAADAEAPATGAERFSTPGFIDNLERLFA